MENSLVTYGFNKDREGIDMGSTKTEKESNTLSGSVISAVLFVLNSAQSSSKKKKWKM